MIDRLSKFVSRVFSGGDGQQSPTSEELQVPSEETLIEGPHPGKPDPAQLIRSGEAPSGMKVHILSLAGEKKPFNLPSGLQVYKLDLSGSAVTEIPSDITVGYQLNISDCPRINQLPTGLKVSSLMMSRCPGITSLPEKLEADFLNVDGCTSLETWPDTAVVRFGSVNASGCSWLKKLPSGLGPITNLNLSGCVRIQELPADLDIHGWVDIAGTQINSLPEPLSNVTIRWNGVVITPQIAFFPETLKTEQILKEKNVEVRRVMLERYGLERLVEETDVKVLDEDTDPGGQRRLLRIPLDDDEDVVCVTLICPSTGRQYVVRVPPGMKTCHQAVAWTAGFENPDDYRPAVET